LALNTEGTALFFCTYQKNQLFLVEEILVTV